MQKIIDKAILPDGTKIQFEDWHSENTKALDEWGVNHNTTPDGYHTDWGEFSKDITLHGKSYAMKQYNRGKYTVKDE